VRRDFQTTSIGPYLGIHQNALLIWYPNLAIGDVMVQPRRVAAPQLVTSLGNGAKASKCSGRAGKDSGCTVKHLGK
jgi:hypothetical protein